MNIYRMVHDKEMSISDATDTLNGFRLLVGNSPVSERTVRREIQRMAGKGSTVRTPHESMNRSLDSAWMEGRGIAFVEFISRVKAYREGKATAIPIELDGSGGVAWWDENCQHCLRRPFGKHQRLFHCDKEGKPVWLDLADDDEIAEMVEAQELTKQEAKARKKGKYECSASGAFGVAFFGGKAYRFEPFRYAQTVVGKKTFDKAVQDELMEPTNIGTYPYGPPEWAAQEAGRTTWEDKYKEKWKDVLMARVRKKKINVCDIIDHMFEETAKVFKGTKYEKNWMIYHGKPPALRYPLKAIKHTGR